MDSKKKYTKADFDRYTEAVRNECEQTVLRQRERIDELRAELAAAEKKIAEFESTKGLVYKAITAAVKKADDIERVALIKYNQEIAQLKAFHDKWVGYFNKIIQKYPLDSDLVAASKVNEKIAHTLDKAGDIESMYNAERDRLARSVADERAQNVSKKETAITEDYDDRSPAGFSISEALHPQDDLKDIMKELGIIIDE